MSADSGSLSPTCDTFPTICSWSGVCLSRTCWTTRVHQAVVQVCPSSSREPWPGRSASWSVLVGLTRHGPSAGWIQVSSWHTDCISLTVAIKASQVTTGKIFIQDMILNETQVADTLPLVGRQQRGNIIQRFTSWFLEDRSCLCVVLSIESVCFLLADSPDGVVKRWSEG